MTDCHAKFTYAQVERIFAILHGATGEAQATTFRARLKHLKRLGIPRDSKPGRGKKIHYTEDQFYEWLFCLELAEFGLDPSTIVGILDANWTEIAKCLNSEASHDVANETVMLIRPSYMESAWRDSPAYELMWMRRLDLALFNAPHRRAIIINVTALLRQASRACEKAGT